MSPDELSQRVARLEAGMARIEGDVATLKEVVHSLSPLTTQTAVLAQKIGELDRDMIQIEKNFESRLNRIEKSFADDRAETVRYRREREELEKAARKETMALEAHREDERRDERRWRIGIAVVIALGALSSAVTLIVALIG